MATFQNTLTIRRPIEDVFQFLADIRAEALREALIRHVTELKKVRPEKLVRRRAEKYAAMGAYSEA